jgi:hypothetical protein
MPGATQTPLAAPPGAVNPDEDLLVRTVYGEARGEDAMGQQAVASVVRNRATASGKPIRDVVMAPNQFEPWNNPQTRAQLEALDPNSPEYKAILANLRAGQGDPTGGATHFYSPTAQAALGRSPPAWAQGQGTDIGRHRFYNLPYGDGPAPQGGMATPVAAQRQGAPQPPQQQAGGMGSVQFHMDRAQRLQAAGFQQEAQMEMQRAQLAQREALRTPRAPDPLETVRDPGSSTGYRLVPRGQAGGMEAPEPRPMVSIQNSGESAFEKERAGTIAKRVSEWEDATTRSAQTMTRLNRMETLINEFQTGKGAQTAITAGQLAQRLGVPQATMEALGIDPARIASGEALNSLASQMLVGMIGSGGFPAQAFSNADREMLERSLPGLANSPGGNRAIIQIMKASAQRDLEIGRAWREWSGKNGDNLASVRAFQMERLPAIIEKDIVAPILEEGGWLAVPSSAPGAPDAGGPKEGATATNKQTGEKLIFRGGQWGPAQ